MALAVITPFLALAEAPDTRPDWLRFVPGDVHFYVELNDLDGIRQRFRKLGIWGVVRRLTEGSDLTTTQPSHHQAGEMLGMNPDTAITHILGRRSALFATSPAKWKSGVILAEADQATDIQRLLKKWGAKSRGHEGPVRRFILRGGSLLAVRDRLMVLGVANDPEGLWNRTVLLLSGKRGPHLQGRSEFASMRTRLRSDHAGFAYMAWGEEDPYAIANCRRLILGFTLTDSELQCELHGQRENVTETLTHCDTKLVRNLPADTLFVWTGSFDTEILRSPPRGTVLDDDRSLIGLFVGILGVLDQSPDQFLKKLGPRFTILMGPDPEARPNDCQLAPITLLCQARDPEMHVKNLDMIIRMFASGMEMAAARWQNPHKSIEVRTQQFEGVTLSSITVGPVLAKRFGLELLERLEVCWAVLDGQILLSISTTEHVKQVIRAIRGQTKRMGDQTEIKTLLPDLPEKGQPVELLLLQGNACSTMLTNCLRYLVKHHPAAVRDQWWQTWAAEKLQDRGRLAIGLREDATKSGQAIVAEIAPNSPATGVLHVGDHIVSAAGQPLTSKHPAQEVKRRYDARGSATHFELGVLRRGKRVDVRIPVSPVSEINLQDFKPIRALGQLTILLHRIKTMAISRYGTNPDRFDVDIVIRWNTSKRTAR